MTQTHRARALSAMVVAAVLAASLLVLVVGTRPAEAAFPGSNGAIAYNHDNQIYRMSADGFGQTQLSVTGTLNRDADWSSDGKKIVYRSGNDPSGEIYWMNSDGSEATNLTNDPANDSWPSLFPDSHKIAFTSNRSGDNDIYVMTLNDQGTVVSDPIRMTTSPYDDYRPAVSPDGKKIAFVSDRSGHYDVYVMNAVDTNGDGNGDSLKRLTKHSSTDDAPDWSPNGKKIVFISDRSRNSDIWVMKPVPESSTNRPLNLTKDPAVDDDPAFSPDGRKIAFSRFQGDWDVFKMRVDGTHQTEITVNTDVEDLYPSWQPDP